jgi:tetratricopeptide (TPR) repeat protein
MRGITNGPNFPENSPYSLLARIYGSYLEAKTLPQFETVVKSLEDINAIPGEFLAYAFKIRGISYYHLGKYNESIADLAQSDRMIPYADNLYYIGMCYYNKEDIKQASDYFLRVITSTEDRFFKSAAYYQLGEIDYYQNKFEEALAQYFKAINNYSNSADYSYKIAKCLQKLKYNTLSPKFLKISLRIQKDYANAWFFLNIY